MPTAFTKEELKTALDGCAAEPIHIPSRVQPYACLVAFDPTSGTVQYASENCQSIIGLDASVALGAHCEAIFDRGVVHALRNASADPRFETRLVSLGTHIINGENIAAQAFQSDGMHVIEFERELHVDFGSDRALDALALALETINTCNTQAELFDATVDLMRHLSGYDRVVIYKFDQDYNGEVISEVKRASMESFLGLRFPSYDIPEQARAMMARLPVRFIEDVDQTPLPLLAAEADLPPLDISLANTRGVSKVHIEYLRNMGLRATMTLSILANDALWGVIAFHHRQPKIPAPKLREVLTRFLPIFSSKLQSLQQAELLGQISHVEHVLDDLMDKIDRDTNLEAFFPEVMPVIKNLLQADGSAVFLGGRLHTSGQIPDKSVMQDLIVRVQAKTDKVLSIDNLGEQLPDRKEGLNGLGGALVCAASQSKAICFFRRETIQNVSWAGSTEKQIEKVDGSVRLKPRGSFMTYLEEMSGRSDPWSDQNLLFTKRIWAIVNTAERRALLNTLNRQQTIMIDELNHRVRNILALVRSVSEQARRRYGSLNSYAQSLESRIQALAASHNIASATPVYAVSLHQLIRAEFEPFEEGAKARAHILGTNPSIKAEAAPMFSLVMHELATNAVKYGALSNDNGTVVVEIEEQSDAFSVLWREQDGPVVAVPNETGFGTALIKNAIPHEMKGEARLVFNASGVEAEFLVPKLAFDFGETLDDKPVSLPSAFSVGATSEDAVEVDVAFGGTVLVLEDSFVLAKEIGDQLLDAGFDDVARFSTVADALAFAEIERPDAAVLDVNLGQGQTSESAALSLQALGVPFLFLTGYGDNLALGNQLDSVPRLSKPVEKLTLLRALAKAMAQVTA